MRKTTVSLFFLLFLSAEAFGQSHGFVCAPRVKPLTRLQFEAVMKQIATGWNKNDAGRAASCFTADAVYSSVPNAAVRKGRRALYQWFGGERGRPKPMRMEWHHLIFDSEQQIGVGEYTFDYQVQTHGLVIVKFTNGLVSLWREYEEESPLPWKQAVGNCDF